MKMIEVLNFLPGDEALDDRALKQWKQWAGHMTNIDTSTMLNAGYRMGLHVAGDTNINSKDPMGYFKWRNSVNL